MAKKKKKKPQAKPVKKSPAKNLTKAEKQELNAKLKAEKQEQKRQKMIELYGDESPRTLSIVKKVRTRSILSWILVIGIVLTGVMQAMYMISDNSKVTPIGTDLVWKKSGLHTTLQSVWIDEAQGGMTMQLKLDEEAVDRIPYQGDNFAVVVSQSGVKANQKFPLVFSRFDTNGQIAQLSIALQGFSKSKPLKVTIASRETLDKLDDKTDSGLNIDNSKNVGDLMNQLQEQANGGSKKGGFLSRMINGKNQETSPIDYIEFSVIPNYKENKVMKANIFSYDSDRVATFEPKNVLYYLYTKDKIAANEKAIKDLEAQIPTINKIIKQDKARIAANPKDVDATTEANNMQAKLTEINTKINDLKDDIQTIKDIPSSKLVLSPLTEGYTSKP